MSKDFASVIIFIIAAYLGLLLTISSFQHPVDVSITLYPSSRVIEVRAFVLPIIALLLATPLYVLNRTWDTTIDPVIPVASCATLLVGIGAALGQLSWVAAAVVLTLASGAFAATWLLLMVLWRGETMEIESRWGGIGGGLGGWRLSRAASLCLLALALIAGSVAAISSPAKGPDEPETKKTKTVTGKSESGSAASEHDTAKNPAR